MELSTAFADIRVSTGSEIDTKLQELSIKIWDNSGDISQGNDRGKIYRKLVEEYLNILKFDTRKVTRFLSPSYSSTELYNPSNKQPLWFAPSMGELFSLDMTPIFQLTPDYYGVGYNPTACDHFMECINLALNSEKYRNKVNRIQEPTWYFQEKRNMYVYIAGLFFYSIADEPVDIRKKLSDEFVKPGILSSEEIYDIIVKGQRKRQEQRGFKLVKKVGDPDDMKCVRALLLDKRGEELLDQEDKNIYIKVFTELELGGRGGILQSNSKYFTLLGGEAFLMHVEERCNEKKESLLREYRSTYSSRLKPLAADVTYFMERGASILKRSLVSNSWTVSNLFQSLKSKGLGDISRLIGIVANLINVNIYLFDEKFENLIATGIVEAEEVILVRKTESDTYELGGVVCKDNSTIEVKFIFRNDDKDLIVKTIREKGVSESAAMPYGYSFPM